MTRLWTITRRELGALFNQPTGYVLLVVFLVIGNFLFFRQILVSREASLRPLLELLPWIFLFFVPAVTMRTLADDTRTGVVETVLAQPLTELEFLLGKYLGAVLFLAIALGLTGAVPLAMTAGAHLQWGPIAAQYAGALLLAMGLAGVGVWSSSLTRSQITAFILAVAVMFGLILLGLNPVLLSLPPAAAAVASRLGVLSHFESIGRGVIDLRDAIYFISLSAGFLALAYEALMTRRLARGGADRRRLALGTTLLLAGFVIVNLLGGYIGGRLDLTPGRVYTLSKATRQLVGNLDDLVTIKLFASKELPTEAALIRRDVDDLLGDLRAAGHGKVRVVPLDPAANPTSERDAQALGIQPVEFNVIGESELQVKKGYLGIAIQYADGVEAIPFVRQTDDLEYRLASAIRNLTRVKKPAVGLLNLEIGQEGEPGMSFQALSEQLGKSYEVRTLSPSDSTPFADDIAALVLVGSPDTVTPANRARLERFFARGGGTLIMASGMVTGGRSPTATARPVGWNEVLRPFGLSITSDLVYDLQSNQIVPLRSEFGQVLTPYPLWLRAISTRLSVVNEQSGEVFLPWTSSVDTTGAPPGTVTPLLVTSRAAGSATGTTSLDPRGTFPQYDLHTRLLAAMAAPAAGDSSQPRHGRVIVVGNSGFASDHYASMAPDNLVFALNAVDWLAQDEALIAIRSRDRRPPQLMFTSPATAMIVEYGNVVGLPVLVALLGLIRLLARRRASRLPYRRTGEGPDVAAAGIREEAA